MTIFLVLLFAGLMYNHFRQDGEYWNDLAEFLDIRDARILQKFKNNQDHKGH